MQFKPTRYFLELLRDQGIGFLGEDGSAEFILECPKLNQRLYSLDYLVQFKISQNRLFKYLLGDLEIKVYTLRHRRKRLLKGRIIGSSGNIIRSLASSTKTRIYTLGYKFCICGSPEGVDKAFSVISRIGQGRGYGLSFRDL